MEPVRKPLTDNNVSRIGRLTRLPTPGSKRQRSPENLPSYKRSRLDVSGSSATAPVRNAALHKGRPIASRGGVGRGASRNATVVPKVGVTVTKRPPVSAPARQPPQRAPTQSTRCLSTASKATTGTRVNNGAVGSKAAARTSLGKNKTPIQASFVRIQELEDENSSVTRRLTNLEDETDREIRQLQRKVRDSEDELASTKRKYQRDYEDLDFSKSTLQRQKDVLDGELRACQQEASGLKITVSQLTSAQAGIKAELDANKVSLDRARTEIRSKDEMIATANQANQQLRKEVSDAVNLHTATIDEHKRQQCEHESMRRKLHNTIQELKGNIRVFCRVRPLIGDEMLGNDGVVNHMKFPDTDSKILELEKLSDASLNESCLTKSRNGQNRFEFVFDKVFQPASTQDEVFDEISQLIQSALDGYNVSIFAYGQTGSGKTYTMEGPNCTDDELTMGMIPRSVMQIFQTAEDLADKGWKYEFEASFLEIYNETIHDLLGNNSTKHEIKLSGPKNNDVVITNLTAVNVSSETQVFNLLKKASERRAVAETKCNERSSRSHSVFRMKLSGSNSQTSESCQGTLNLIDLAGSERLKESCAEGQRLKETQSINKSLSNLGNVIMALTNKENHVPYRNSKLTYMLQNSLGGNSKTLMFVNVSPREEHIPETVRSLRFATVVNQCNIGTAQKKSSK